MSESQHRRGDAQDRHALPAQGRHAPPAQTAHADHPLPETRKNAESAERNARSTAESGRFC